MYNITEIQKAFKGLVGFRQPNDPYYPEVNSDLSEPITGMFLSHPLADVETLFNAGPDFKGYDPEPTEEQLDEIFNKYLQNIYDDSCTDLVSKLIQVKKVRDSARSLLEQQELYTGFGFVGDKIIKHSRFVGFQIDIRKKRNLMAIISKIGFQVDEIQTVKFYLYHTSQVEPIKTFDFVVTRASSFNWADAGAKMMLSYLDGNTNSNGFYFFGYYEDDIQGQAIKMDKNLSKSPCLSCNAADLNYYNAWSKYIGIASISVESEFIDEDRNIFDVSKVVYVDNSNWGINLSITTACDLTVFFSQNKLEFVDALKEQITLNILNKVAYSKRLNGITDKTKGLAMADLASDDKSSFLNQSYKVAIDALRVDFSGFDRDCLPCMANRGVTVGAI